MNTPPTGSDFGVGRRGFVGAALALGAGCATPPSERAARLDEEFRDLEDRSGEVEPIAAHEFARRRQRLGAALSRAGVDAFLCEGGATMTWLSGVGWGHSERAFLLIVFADGSHRWLSPAFEAEKARLRIEGPTGPGGEIDVWQEHEYAFRPLAALLERHRVARAAFDPMTRLFVVEGLRGAFGESRVGFGRELIASLRMRKDDHELAILRKASELTKAALVAVARRAHAGLRSGEVAEWIDAAQRRLGLRSPWNLTLVGPAAAYPHGETAAQTIQRDDLLLIDTGGSLHGYQSDVTRTWVVEGRGRERELRAWHSVRAAQRAAFEAIRPGLRCGEIDRVARAALARDGWGEGYSALTHRLGHGIGVEGHEDPYFDGGSDVELEPGMTLSNEPGIYVLGEFGVRIEDVIAVTAGADSTPAGAQVFGDWQSGPLAPD